MPRTSSTHRRAAIARLAVLTQAMHLIELKPFTPAYIDALAEHAAKKLSAENLLALTAPWTRETLDRALAAVAGVMPGPNNPRR